MAGTVFACKFKRWFSDLISYNDTVSAYILPSFLQYTANIIPINYWLPLLIGLFVLIA